MKVRKKRLSDSKKKGLIAERLFVELAEKDGYQIKSSSGYQDRIEHWDKKITKNGESWRVDVKAIKCIYIGVEQDGWHWVEVKGIHGHKGWLYGKADLFAFETFVSFVVIERERLACLVEEKADLKTIVKEKRMAMYKSYRREGRKDLMTLVSVFDIRELAWAEILKPKPPKEKAEVKPQPQTQMRMF